MTLFGSKITFILVCWEVILNVTDTRAHQLGVWKFNTLTSSHVLYLEFFEILNRWVWQPRHTCRLTLLDTRGCYSKWTTKWTVAGSGLRWICSSGDATVSTSFAYWAVILYAPYIQLQTHQPKKVSLSGSGSGSWRPRYWMLKRSLCNASCRLSVNASF